MIALPILLLLVITVPFFLSKKLSPVPYFPSNKKDVPLIVKELNLRNNQVVYDLGAGDGAVIWAAAQYALAHSLNTRFIAVEINPILLIIMWMRRLMHPNKKNIHIMKGDMFSMKFEEGEKKTTFTFFLYISPWYLEKAYANITRQKKKFDLVSYFYELPKETKLKGKKTSGIHNVYTYKK
jgi:hypothetical protein